MPAMDSETEYNIRNFLSDYQLGVTHQILPLETIPENKLATEHMLQQARHSIDILSRHMDKPIYNTNCFIELIVKLSRNNPRSEIRILIHDATNAVKEGHRLIQLSQKLSSFVHIRIIHSDYVQYNEAFLIADNVGLIHRQYSDRYEGTANFNAPLHAIRYKKLFTEIWEISEEDPQLRRLSI
jgi:hypothetical protein